MLAVASGAAAANSTAANYHHQQQLPLPFMARNEECLIDIPEVKSEVGQNAAYLSVANNNVDGGDQRRGSSGSTRTFTVTPAYANLNGAADIQYTKIN